MIACPPDEELLPLADAESGVEAEAAVRIHVASCPSCTRRKERMSAELRSLRDAFSVSQSVLLRGPAKSPPQSGMPATIGKYVVISTLGAGGQATVYRAAHKGLGREVVIKLARKSVRPGDADMLAAEGKILAELDHPNIARVHDLDMHEGLPYLVMEFVRGRTLEEYARQHSPSPAASAAIAAKVARAIAYAQSRGVSHQDISPRNIIINDAGEPVVIDFGLAKLGNLWIESGDSPSGGTPGYMAPEQARLEANRVESLADVFSLGAVLHFLVAGRSPYRAEPGKALDAAKAGNLDIAPLEKMEKVPPALKDVIRKSLSLNPAERFASAAEFAEALGWSGRPRPQPNYKIVAGLAAAALIGIIAWIALSTRRAPAEFPSGVQEILHVTSYPAAVDALPLRDGDRVRVEARVARGANVAAYWLSDGEVTEMPVSIAPGADFDVASAPGGSSDVPLQSSKGTEAVIIIASRRNLATPVEREYMRILLLGGVKAAPLEKLADDTLVYIGTSGSTSKVANGAEGRPIDLSRVAKVPWSQAVAGLESTLKRLRNESRDIDFYAGAAFPTRGEK